METDIRTNQSREIIRQAMRACMAEAPLSDIRVKDVVERAGVNKTTFYKYYRDMEALAAEEEQALLEQFMAEWRQSEGTAEAQFRIGFGLLDKIKVLFHTQSGGTIPGGFRDALIRTVKACIAQSWKEKLPRLNAEETGLLLEGFIAAALQMALTAKEGTDREKLIRAAWSVFDGYIEQEAERVARRPGRPQSENNAKNEKKAGA